MSGNARRRTVSDREFPESACVRFGSQSAAPLVFRRRMRS